jgi:acyl carrier protein
VILPQADSPRWVILQEIEDGDGPRLEEIESAIRGAVLARGIVAEQVVLVAPSSLPRGPDGTVARGACEEAYRAGRLSPLARAAEPAPRSATEAALAQIWSEILDVNVSAHDRFVDFTDSISATEYVNRVRETFQLDIPPTALFDKVPTVAKLADLIETLTGSSAPAARPAVPPTAAPEARPVEPLQMAHAIALPGGAWHVWRTAALRGAGFAASGVLALAAPRAAAAADGCLDARADAGRHQAAALDGLRALTATAGAAERVRLRRVRRQLKKGIVESDDGNAPALRAAFDAAEAAEAAFRAAYDADAAAVEDRVRERDAGRPPNGAPPPASSP